MQYDEGCNSKQTRARWRDSSVHICTGAEDPESTAAALELVRLDSKAYS